jgi:hypothetical protein
MGLAPRDFIIHAGSFYPANFYMVVPSVRSTTSLDRKKAIVGSICRLVVHSEVSLVDRSESRVKEYLRTHHFNMSADPNSALLPRRIVKVRRHFYLSLCNSPCLPF